MANVPYSPVPNVAPTVPGLPRVGIETPPAAFGAATAAAVRGLGQQTEQSSNEMFGTAMYVQQLRNDTWAKNDFVNRSAQIGDIENKLYSLKGQEAVNFAPEASRQIQQIYQNATAQAPNPQAARMLGDQLSRRIAYSLVDIGRHSGQEQLRAAGDASASTMAVGLDLVSRSPLNDDLFNDYVREDEKNPGLIQREAANLERLGFGKSEANAIKLRNQYWEARFESLYGKPDQAQALYDRLENQIPPEARQKILQNIRSSESTVRFNQTYGASVDKAQTEAAVSEISSRNRIIDPATGQAGYGPNATQELLDFNKTHPGSDKEVHERLEWIRQANEDAAKGVVIQTNPDVLSALTKNMFDPTNPTSERDLAKAENDRTISAKDRDWLLNTIRLRNGAAKEDLSNPIFKIANDAAKALVEGTTAKSREMNAGNYAAFQYDFLTEYLKRIREGKLQPYDLDMGNEKSLIRQKVETYVPGIGQTIRNNGGVGTPTVPASASPEAIPATATPTTAPPISLPPVKDRVKDQTYMTGRGFMTWTGTGWVPPKAPEALQPGQM